MTKIETPSLFREVRLDPLEKHGLPTPEVGHQLTVNPGTDSCLVIVGDGSSAKIPTARLEELRTRLIKMEPDAITALFQRSLELKQAMNRAEVREGELADGEIVMEGVGRAAGDVMACFGIDMVKNLLEWHGTAPPHIWAIAVIFAGFGVFKVGWAGLAEAQKTQGSLGAKAGAFVLGALDLTYLGRVIRAIGGGQDPAITRLQAERATLHGQLEQEVRRVMDVLLPRSPAAAAAT